MEFNEKLQQLRKEKGLTQEELAEKIYVSRTAISKWESGRGYPSIDSLKTIANFFSVTVDALLSSDEILTLAQDDQRQRERQFHHTVFGLIDLCMALLLVLPFFAERIEGVVYSVSLWTLGSIQPYVRIFYFSVILGMVLLGILILTLQNFKIKISIALNVAAVLLFVISLQPYAAIFAFVLLAVKVFVLLK